MLLPQDANLTARERQRLEYQRQVYELAKQKKQTEDALKRNDDYRMPDSYDPEGGAANKRYDVLTQRFKCAAGRGLLYEDGSSRACCRRHAHMMLGRPASPDVPGLGRIARAAPA